MNDQHALLQVTDLSVAFRQGDSTRLVVDKVSFSINKGETLALVGESGSGKSVTAYAIMRLLPYPMAFHPSGEVYFDGQPLLNLKQEQMRRLRGSRIGMIFQEPMTALNPLHTVEKQISEVIMQHRGISRAAARPLVLSLLEQVQIQEPASRLTAYPHELSGGQRQRVMIAMALANEPELLIADEPTTALDVTVQREILDLLRQIQAERQLAMLLITHDLGVVRHMAQRVAVMRQGQLLETSGCEALFAAPAHEYTRMLINSDAKGEAVEMPVDSQVILRTRDLCVNFPLQKNFWGKTRRWLRAVQGANLQLRRGETLGIVGESGSGKSTLAQAILRLINSTGEIHYGQDQLQLMSNALMRPLRARLQIVFQDPFASLSPRMTVEEIIQEGLLIHSKLSPAERVEAVKSVMQEVGLNPSDRHRYPHEFSGGQRQRIAIARAIILNPEILVLDEPTSALDKAVQAQVIELLKSLQRDRQLSYLFISHDLKVVRAISHRILVMKNGVIVEAGSAAQVLSEPSEEYTRTLLAASFA